MASTAPAAAAAAAPQRAAMLAALDASSLQPFLLSDAWKASADGLHLLTSDQRERFLTALNAEVADTVQRHLLDPAAGDDSENAPPPAASAKDAPPAAAPVAFLSAATATLFAYAEDKAIELPAPFLAVAETLHGALFYIPEDRDGLALQRDVCRLCERLWSQERTGREAVVCFTLPLLLIRALEEGSPDASIRRLWALREAVGLFDLEDPENGNLRELLVRCFASPSFLRTADNRKLLAHVLAHSPAVVPDVASVLRASLPSLKARGLDAAAELVYKAWFGSSGGPRLALETGLIQDLMARGVGATSPTTFACVRRLLTSAFVERKKSKGVDGMLARLYRPILFRALEAANGAMRRNAAVLLLDAFPLRDADAADGDALLQKQFSALGKLLLDPSPGVREVGVAGAARVLASFWEIIPGPAAGVLLERLALDAAADARAPSVRCAVAAALEFLVEGQVLSHPALASVLPRYLENALNDRNEKVRAGASRLLAAIGRVRTLLPSLFDGFVSVDALLARLTLDAGVPAVAEPLVAVLVHSFFPSSATNTALWQRTARSLKDQEAATFAFFAYAHKFVPVPTLVKHVLVLKAALRKTIATAAAAAVSSSLSAKAEADKCDQASSGIDGQDDDDAAHTTATAPAAADDAEGSDSGVATAAAAASAMEEEEGEEEEEDDGFRRKRKGKATRATKRKAAAPASRASAVAATSTAAPLLHTAAAAAAAAPPQGQSSSPNFNLRLMAGVCRVIATIIATIAPALEATAPAAAVSSPAAAAAADAHSTDDDDGGAGVVAPPATSTAAPAAAKRGSGRTRSALSNTSTTTIAAAAAVPQHSPDDDAAAEEDEDDPLSESRAALAEAFSGAEIAYLLTHLVPTMNSSSSAGGALGENCSSSSNDSSSAASVASTVMSSLLSIASHLPPETVQSEGLKQHLMERLTAMRPPHRTQVEFGSSTDAASAPHCSVNSGGSGVDMQLLLHCLCSWGGGDDVLAAATAALRTATALTVAAPSAPVAAGEGAPQRPISMDPLVAIAAMTGVLALAAVPGGGVAVGQEALFDAMASLAEATQCLSGSLRAAIAIVDSSASAGSAAVGGGALSPDLADAPAEASAAADAAVLRRGAQAGALAATASVGWCRLLLRGVCIMTKAGASAFATSFARSAVATMGGWARRELLPAAVIGADVLARSMFVGSGGGGGTSVFAAEGSGGSAGDEDAFEGVEGDDIALTGPTATTTTMSSQGSCGALPPPTASTTSRSSSGTRTTAAPLVLRHLLTSAGVVTGAIASALSDLVLLGLGDIGPSVALELFSDFTSGDALNAPTPPPAAAVGGTTQRQQRNNEDVEEEEVGSADSSFAWLFTSTTPVDWLVAPSGAQGRGGGAAKGSSGGSSSNDLGQSDVASGALLRLGLRLHAAACASPTAAAHNPQQHQQQFAVGARIRLWRGLARLMVAMGAEAQASDDDAAVASALRRGGSGGTHSSGSSDETYVVPQRQQQGDDIDDASSQSGSSKAATAAAAPSVPRMRSILYESWETALSASAGGSSSSSSGPLMQLQDMLGAMLPELEAAVSPTSPALTAAAAAQPSDATAAPATGASKKKKAAAAAAAAAAASPEGLQCHALSTLIRATVAAGGALDGVSSGRALGQVLAHRLYVLQRIAKEEAETVGGVAGERRQHHHRRQGSRAALAMDEEEADDDHEDDDGDAIGGAAAAGTPSPGTLASIATVRAIGAAYCSVAPSKPAKEVAAAIAAMLDCGAQ